MTQPAFPHIAFNTAGGINVVHAGMTLRDWFAGQALIALIGFGNDLEDHTCPDDAPLNQIAASQAYGFADAMIHERSKHCSDCGRNLSETGGGSCQTCEVQK